MQLDQLIQEKKSYHTRRQRATSILLVLSLFVSSGVFYNLRLTGITLAGDAHCGIEEHTHGDACYAYTLTCPLTEAEKPPDASETDDTAAPPHTHSEEGGCYQKKLMCSIQEHVHDLSCYSDDEADVETPAEWEATFESVSTESRVEALVAIAQTQIGYQESDKHFRTENGERQGYTRYGAWYGSPYGKWSSLFTSFCLSYAGFTTEETPYAQSGESMRVLWEKKGLYRSRGTYTGEVGDVVFLEGNLTGIIYKRMPDYIHVILGDVEGRVQTREILVSEPEILGYGVIPREEGTQPYDLTPLTITVSGRPKKAPKQRAAAYATRAPATRAGEPTDIKEYVEQIGGTFNFTLLNVDTTPIVPDENGNVVLKPNFEYLFSITMHSGEEAGFVPGRYTYTIDDTHKVNTLAGTGEIVMANGTNLGRWEIDGAGHLILDLNENVNSLVDVLINVTAGIIFPADTDVNLDGNIHVTVRPEGEEEEPLMNVFKSGYGVVTDEEGNLLDGNGNPYNHHILPWGDPLYKDSGYERIYWNVYIEGERENALAGYEITDQILTPKTHYFSAKDMEAGVVVKYVGTNLQPYKEHWFTLTPDTPGVEWTETGFTYTIPEELYCEDPGCPYKNQWVNPNNDPITLGPTWTAYINYFTTLRPFTENGWKEYANKVYVDDKDVTAHIGQTVSSANANIQKDGVFNGQTGDFQWLVSVFIPKQSEENISKPWMLTDITKLAIDGGVAYDFPGAFRLPVERVIATIGTTQYEVPYIDDIPPGERPPLAYCYSYIEPNPTHYMEMQLLRPCNCTGHDNCSTWDTMGRCVTGSIWIGDQTAQDRHGYCRCWNIEEDVLLHIEYSSPGPPVIEETNNRNGEYINIINLNQVEFQMQNGWPTDQPVQAGTDTAKVPVPSVFDKVLEADPNKENSYIASYSITVNESKVDLSIEDNIRIEDTMSNTLVYLPGTLRVETEDVAGNTGQLVYGEDYMLTVGGSGNQLMIEIYDPGPLKYSFYYDCRITVPPGQTSLMFNNAAKVTLFGQVFEDEQTPKQIVNVAVSANNYSLNVHKLDGDTGDSVAGALIGFFAENGEKIMEYTSGTQGLIQFKTDISKGIIMREHVLYYVQEVRPPPHYQLDDTKHYLFFCDQDEPCEKCAGMVHPENGATVMRVQTGTPGSFTLYNMEIQYELPATGGNGPLLFYIIGLALIAFPSIYIICSLRRRKGRRFKPRPLSFTAKTWLCRRNR